MQIVCNIKCIRLRGDCDVFDCDCDMELWRIIDIHLVSYVVMLRFKRFKKSQSIHRYNIYYIQDT